MKRLYRRSAGRSTYELIVLVLVIGLAVAVAVGIFARRSTVTNERLLISELAMLRSGVVAYRANHDGLPATLESALDEAYGPFGAAGYEGAAGITVDERDVIIDPFGNAYRYDSASGWVSSASPGYEQW